MTMRSLSKSEGFYKVLNNTFDHHHNIPQKRQHIIMALMPQKEEELSAHFPRDDVTSAYLNSHVEVFGDILSKML